MREQPILPMRFVLYQSVLIYQKKLNSHRSINVHVIRKAVAARPRLGSLWASGDERERRQSK